MKIVAIAATALTIGLSSYSLPAFALADDYGQFVYTEQSQSRFAPDGLSLDNNAYRATIDLDSRAVVAPRTNRGASNRSDIYSRIDREHKAW